MKRIWSKEIIKKLVKLYPYNSNRYISEKLGMSIKQIRNKSREMKLIKQIKSYTWSKTEVEDLIKLYPISDQEFLEKYFNRSIKKIYNKAKYLNIKKTKEYIEKKQILWFDTLKKSGKSYRFTKGQISWNNGLKGYMGANVTSFKKGQMPKNFVDVGTERLDADGYTYVKIENPKKWILKHRKIWIDNFGDIPESHAVIFLDGNKSNFDLFNLILVHRRDLLYFNRHGKYPPEIMETQKLIYKLKNLIKNAKEQD